MVRLSDLLNAIPVGVLVGVVARGALVPEAALLAGLLAGAAHALPLRPASARARAAVGTLARRHREALARRRLALLTVDAYGVPDAEAWHREVDRFLDRVVAPHLDGAARAALDSERESLFARVEEQTAPRAAAIEAALDVPASGDPGDFERWCAACLRGAGWRTRLTGASGDQGADVLAEREGATLVLQCKLHARPVGNKAVQEAFAARRHYGAGLAAVVTNAGFTRSAAALAGTTGVLLLHHSELPDLGARLDAERGAEAAR